jgi:hypothetical protein
MKNTYQRTNWVDNVTPVNADNLNKIEGAIDELYSGSVGISQLRKGKGVDIKLTDFRDVELSINQLEMNEMVEHNKYVEGNGIKMKDTTPPPPPIIPTPETTIDEWVTDEDQELVSKPPFPPLHPPTEISIDEDYVNSIVKHNKYIGSEGVIVEKLLTEEPAEGDELIKDNYSVKADIEYIDENITHPNYVGIRGIKIRKPVLDQIFPELEIDERTKVAYLDEDYLNDYAIDVQKLAEKLNIAPIVEYSAGEGLEIVDANSSDTSNEVHETTQSEGDNTPTESDSETAVTEIVPGEDQTMQEAVLEDIINDEIGEPQSSVPEKVYKTIRLDEEWLENKLKDNNPVFNSDPSTGISITKAEEDEAGNEVNPNPIYEVGINKNKLQEYLEIQGTPDIQGEVNSGITVTSSSSSHEEGEDYTPTITSFILGIDPEQLREKINVKENPVLTTENGIILTTTETPSQEHEGTVENWKLGLDSEYVNSIVKHKTYTFRSPFFTYRDIDADHGEISFNEEYFTRRVTDIVNQILSSKGIQ